MAFEEKVYTIPLRKHWIKVSRIDRANTSVDFVKSYLLRHTKTEEIKISPLLNESLWVKGAKKPPAFAKIKVVKDEKGVVNAMLPEEKLEVTEKKGLKHKLLRRKGVTESKIIKGDVKQADAVPEAPKPDVKKDNATNAPENETKKEPEKTAKDKKK